jgi:diacylglycerol O-acyltransferase
VVTNVPGPPVELHLLDAPLVAAYPHLPLFENQGLSVALLSYDGRLFWGLTADWNHGPDLARLKHAVQVAFEELRLAAGVPPWSERRNGRARLGTIAPVKLSVVRDGAPADRRGR